MKPAVRAGIYVVLVILAIALGVYFYRLYSDPKGLAAGTALAVGGLFLINLLCLSLLAAHDIVHSVASLMDWFLYRNAAETTTDPAYERAEQVWADGDHLGAIRLMREYLEKNPREVHVSMRIAEIYEKDLNNPVAAALEYEEILVHPLPPERWGWAAVHLANLYSGPLKKSDEAILLLRRIVDEYPDTQAAKKARERLGIPEPIPEASELTEEGAEQEGAEPSAPAPQVSTSNLPPGFRPKNK